MIQPSNDDIRIPRWVVGLGGTIAILTLALAAVTVPFPWNCPVVPQTASAGVPLGVPAPSATVVPRTLTSTSRTLGDPRAKLALVEYGDFQ